MPMFPKLKTGSIAQYPTRTHLSYNSRVLRFLDGDEQCYRESASALRRWVIRLALLDETETAALESFFQLQQGPAGSFKFVDPQDGMEYENCSFDQDACEFSVTGEMRAEMTLAIKENRI